MDEIKCPVCGGGASLNINLNKWWCGGSDGGGCGVEGPINDPSGSKFRRLVYFNTSKPRFGLSNEQWGQVFERICNHTPRFGADNDKVCVSAKFINELFAHWKTINDGALEIAAAHNIEIVP